MTRKQLIIGCAVILCTLFSVFYYALFNTIEPIDLNEVVSIDEKSAGEMEDFTLYWIQLGVFSETSSYSDLVEECNKLNLNPIVIDSNEKHILVVGSTKDLNVIIDTENKVIDKGYEYIMKDIDLNDEISKKYYENKQIDKILEEYVY